MAKKPFNFDDTPVSRMSEEIRTGTTNNVLNATKSTEERKIISIDNINKSLKPQKKSKGIRIELPIDSYLKLSLIKEHTGKTLQELATQSVLTFIDNFMDNNQKGN